MQVLYGLEYSYVIPQIREELIKASTVSESTLDINYASVICSYRYPSDDLTSAKEQACGFNTTSEFGKVVDGIQYAIGGLSWNIPEGYKMDDYILFWIGSDNSAFVNFVLTFSECEIGR